MFLLEYILPIRTIKNFIKLESSAGIILFMAALIAILVDNSFLSTYYEQFLEFPLAIKVGEFELSKHMIHWINDGLMTIFFFMVGLEIKKEIVEGELNSPSKIFLPAIAALGGMLVPALVFTLFNMGNDFSLRGWAIPTATDIAFSLGILSLLGSRVPLSLKIFLTALAIFDDMGAIIVIALFYNSEISLFALFVSLSLLGCLFVMNKMKVASLPLYLITGFILWLSVLNSGVHATLAGVALAVLIPLPVVKGLDKKLHPWVAYFVLPLFAFANAGVSLDDLPSGIGNLFSPVLLGISLGLLLGKLLGVFLTTFLVIKLGFVKMPTNATWPQVFGIALVCGVGFTMSFFVGTLAYPTGSSDLPYDAWVRLGVIFGSLTSAISGYIVLRLTTKPKEDLIN